MIEYLHKEIKRGKKFISFMLLTSFSKALLFLVPLFIANSLGPKFFGAYSLAMMVVYFFVRFFVRSTSEAFVTYSTKEIEATRKMNKTFTSRLILLFASILLFLSITLVFAEQIKQFASITTFEFYMLFFAFFGLSLNVLVSNLLISQDKKEVTAIFQLLLSVSSLLYLAFLYIRDSVTLDSVLLVFFFSSIISAIFVGWKIDFKKLRPLSYDKRNLSKMLNWAKWSIVGGTAVHFISWGDNLVLKYFVSLEEIGVYNLGYTIFKGLIRVSLGISTYFFIYVVKNIDNKEVIRKYLYNKRPKILSLWILALVIGFFLAPLFFRLFFDESFSGAATVTQILMIGLIFVGYKSFYGPIFASLERYRFSQMANVAILIINMVLDIILIRAYGYIGAAIATSISYGLLALIYEYYFQKHCKRDLLETV